MTTQAYYLPKSVDEAVGLLAEHGPSLLVMAGGTDLVIGLPGTNTVCVLDAGNNGSCAANDQRGVTRPVDGNGDATATCDMGAFEYGIQLEIGDATVTEGDSGTVTASFIVTRSLQTSGTDTVEYATVADSADRVTYTVDLTAGVSRKKPRPTDDAS